MELIESISKSVIEKLGLNEKESQPLVNYYLSFTGNGNKRPIILSRLCKKYEGAITEKSKIENTNRRAIRALVKKTFNQKLIKSVVNYINTSLISFLGDDFSEKDILIWEDHLPAFFVKLFPERLIQSQQIYEFQKVLEEDFKKVKVIEENEGTKCLAMPADLFISHCTRETNPKYFFFNVRGIPALSSTNWLFSPFQKKQLLKFIFQYGTPIHKIAKDKSGVMKGPKSDLEVLHEYSKLIYCSIQPLLKKAVRIKDKCRRLSLNEYKFLSNLLSDLQQLGLNLLKEASYNQIFESTSHLITGKMSRAELESLLSLLNVDQVLLTPNKNIFELKEDVDYMNFLKHFQSLDPDLQMASEVLIDLCKLSINGSKFRNNWVTLFRLS